MVITDRRSGVRPEDIRFVAEPLSKAGVKVIPVAIGNEVDKGELESATDDQGNVIGVPSNEPPMSLADKIIEKALKRKCHCDFYFLHCIDL